MARKYQAYPKYTSSGLEWLGEIPSHWGVKKLKYVGDALIGLTYSPDEVVYENEGTLVLRSSNVQDRKLAFEDNVYVSKAIPPKLRTRQGDILICARNGSRALIGKNAMIDDSAVGASFGAFMSVFRSADNAFLSKVFNSSLFDYQAGTFLTSTINQLTTGNLNSFEVPYPPKAERETIAAFLDHETASIDRLIGKQQRLIELLKEKRQAVISHAVTKGLDPNVPMKDSGVEWLGQVPEHWSVLTLGLLAKKIGSGKTPKGGADVYVDDGITFIRSQNVYDEGLRLDDVVFISEAVDEEMATTRVHQGDILLNITGASIGRCCKFDAGISANVNQHVCIIRLINENFIDFIAWQMKSVSTKEQIDHAQNGAAREGLNFEQISKLKVCLPTDEKELNSICHALTEKVIRLDSIIQKSEQNRKLLQERRTALISAAVTGKIDVRNWQPNTSAQAAESDFPMAAEQAAEADPAHPYARGTGSSLNGVSR